MHLICCTKTKGLVLVLGALPSSVWARLAIYGCISLDSFGMDATGNTLLFEGLAGTQYDDRRTHEGTDTVVSGRYSTKAEVSTSGSGHRLLPT